MLSALIIGYGYHGVTHAAQLKTDTNIKFVIIVDVSPENLKEATVAGYIAFHNLESAYKWLQENHSSQKFDILIDTRDTQTLYKYCVTLAERIDPLSCMLFSSASNKSARKELVAIILDYDSCGDHLLLEGRKFSCVPPDEKERIVKESNFLFEDLKSRTRNKKAILYVGSNRQDKKMDESGDIRNNNGLCFDSFSAVTNKMNAENMDWEFNKLLLADITSRDGEDITIERGQGMKSRKHTVPVHLLKTLHSNPNINLKFNIIITHLNDIATNHADKDVTCYFYDDDQGITDPTQPSIFEAFKTYFSAYPQKIPANITLFLLHFDPFERLKLRRNGIEPNSEILYWSSKQGFRDQENTNNKRIKTLPSPRN